MTLFQSNQTVFLGLTPSTSLNQIKETLTSVVVRTIKKIAKQAFEAKRDFYNEKIPIKRKLELLKTGCWYPSEYFKALSYGIKNFSFKTNQSEFRWCIQQMQLFKNNNYFSTGHLSKHYFEQVKDPDIPGLYEPNHFLLKENKLPSEALKAALQGLSLIDCSVTCQLTYYQVLIETLGTKQFNTHFSNKNTRLEITVTDPEKTFSLLHLEKPNKPSTYKVKKGDCVYFKNISDYQLKHPMGESSGFSVIFVDDTPGKQLYTGLGLPSKGFLEKEINQKLINDYNATPTGFSQLSDSLKKQTILAMEQTSVYGKKIVLSKYKLFEILKDDTISNDEFDGGISPSNTVTFAIQSVKAQLED